MRYSFLHSLAKYRSARRIHLLTLLQTISSLIISADFDASISDVDSVDVALSDLSITTTGD